MKKELLHLIIKTNKADSAFIYFALEANEGLAFYSTLPHENGDPDRRIDLKASISLAKEVRNLIASLSKVVPSLTIESDKIVLDHADLENIHNRSIQETGN